MFSGMLPLLVVLVFFILPMYLLLFTKKWRRRKRRSPLSAKLLRGPGETLRRELDEISWDLTGYIAVLLAVPIMLFAVHVSQSYFGGVPDTATRWIFSGIAMAGVTTYLLVKLVHLSKLRFEFQHGLEAELAMGQELDQLMREGAIVYHDFPAERFNIDHVVLTRCGMYAVETKGRMKPDRGGGKKDATVVFDGKALAFPDWKDSRMLEQARAQARWLTKWISHAIGESVSVRPVVALPGCWVDRKGRDEVMVISGREARYLLDGQKTEKFSDQMMERIAHQLEQRCRDVESTQYGKQEKFGRNVS